jgi:D-alanine--poly(phosphoribitol) ligase subunit 1
MQHTSVQNSLYDTFCESVSKQEGQTAIYFDTGSITFEELKSDAEKLSRVLFELLNGSENRHGRTKVVINTFKRVETFAIWLSCLRQGYIYAFSDPAAPHSRVDSIIDTMEPDLVISDTRLENVYGLSYTIEELYEHIALGSSRELPPVGTVGALDVVYIMFTSGSTGKPKGVAIHNGGILNLISWSRANVLPMIADRTRNVRPNVFSNINSLHFDNSVFDLFCGLIDGHAIVSIETAQTSNPATWVDRLRGAGAEVLFCVPTLFLTLERLRLLKPKYLPTIKLFQFGGEGFPVPALRAFHELFRYQSRFLNVYGPTETSCICSSVEIDDESLAAAQSERFPSIGKMHAGFKHKILDHRGRLCAAEEAGELWIGGENVGLGYFNDAGLTKAAFCQNPSHDDFRDIWYRTGDLVQQDQDGYLWFAGRENNQIKLRGYRIELEEIDAAIERCEGVKRANAVKVEDAGTECIAAFFVSSIAHESRIMAGFCREVLPGYMVPSHFFQLEAMPENGNGKVDRRALTRMATEKLLEAANA